MKPASHSFFHLNVRPWGLLSSAGAVACCATLFGFMGRLSWFFDLFSNFRVQYLAGLILLGGIFVAAKRRWVGGIFLGFACINLAMVIPLYIGPRPQPPADAQPLRVMLLNVNTQQGDARRVREVVETVDPDILLLEEINERWVADLAWLTNSYPQFVIDPRDDNFGIGLFSKLPLTEKAVVTIGHSGVPSIIVTATLGNSPLRIIGTHPPPPSGAVYSSWRNGQLAQLPDHVSADTPTLLMGDLNATPWSHHFKRLVRNSGLIDSGRGRGFQPSWPTHNPLLRIPIDHLLHSPDIHIVNRTIGPAVGSDHYPLIVDLLIEKKEQDYSSTTTRKPTL